ncbi:MAG: L-glutamate gamma-semialdehyde dehydrogenase [Elusimicrobiota bacterium]|nr:L-glutamate gamma-semialdehyde dehydrogenase [Elusimicrobiota bacterium]
MNSILQVPKPYNEPILSYTKGSKEKKEIKAKLAEMQKEVIEIPLMIGGKEVKTGNMGEIRIPHDHKHIIAKYHKAGKKEIEMAAKAAREAKGDWDNMPFGQRAAIFLKAAELLAGPMRATLNASTMLGQSKNVFQAEIDAVCELADFFRFNTYYAEEIYKQQPSSPNGTWNYMDYRPLEGFVFAATPFNFTSIAGNLPSAPAIMGNTVLWKPASTAVHSAYYLMKLFKSAGLPDGVINMLPGSGSKVGGPVLDHKDFAGIHFTGSTPVFKSMWASAVKNLDNYKSYPRIVGETGGKDFIFAHASANPEALKTAIVRGAFEYQGQKCSAASRAYIPKSLWAEIKDDLVAQVKTIKMGAVDDFTNAMNAVIDEAAFDNIKTYIRCAEEADDAKIIVGGKCDKKEGYFIEPTIIETSSPDFRTMQEEIFGPVMTIYPYDDNKFEETLKICDETSPYALTGAVISQDRQAIIKAMKELRNAAGNFYINDKPTGAVVGQQPFGGARGSGTNDKAGSMLNLIRWVSPRTVKETFVPATNYRYPFMEDE